MSYTRHGARCLFIIGTILTTLYLPYVQIFNTASGSQRNAHFVIIAGRGASRHADHTDIHCDRSMQPATTGGFLRT